MTSKEEDARRIAELVTKVITREMDEGQCDVEVAVNALMHALGVLIVVGRWPVEYATRAFASHIQWMVERRAEIDQ